MFLFDFQYPLHLAVITNQPLLVETLLAKGCDRCVTDRYGNTASHLAVQLNHSECLIKLLTRTTSLSHMTAPFPDINILNYEGKSFFSNTSSDQYGYAA